MCSKLNVWDYTYNCHLKANKRHDKSLTRSEMLFLSQKMTKDCFWQKSIGYLHLISPSSLKSTLAISQKRGPKQDQYLYLYLFLSRKSRQTAFVQEGQVVGRFLIPGARLPRNKGKQAIIYHLSIIMYDYLIIIFYYPFFDI